MNELSKQLSKEKTSLETKDYFFSGLKINYYTD